MWLDLILFAKAFGPSNPTRPAHPSYPAQPTPLTAPDFPEWDGSWTVALGRTGQRRKWLPCPWNQSRPLPTQTMAVSHPSTHPANFNLPPHHPQSPPHTVCLPPPPSTREGETSLGETGEKKKKKNVARALSHLRPPAAERGKERGRVREKEEEEEEKEREKKG